jgi:hypothetical protein
MNEMRHTQNGMNISLSNQKVQHNIKEERLLLLTMLVVG